MSEQSLSIVSVTVSNFKKIQVVRLDEVGEVVQVTGENGAGKSSFMEGIIAALGGKEYASAVPVRRGAKNSEVEIDLGDFTLTDRYIAKTGSHAVELRTKEGDVLGQPRARLGSLIGAGLALDPMAFMGQSAKHKRLTLLELIGVDLSGYAKRHSKAFDQRAGVNRDLKRAQGRIGEPVEAPDEEVSLVALSEDLSKAKELESANRRQRRKAGEMQDSAERLTGHRDRAAARVSDALRELASSEMHLKTAKAQEADARAASKDAVAGLAKLADPATEAIIRQIRDAEGINRRVRARQEREEAVAEAGGLQVMSKGLTRDLAGIEEEKVAELESAKMPVEGLTIRDDGLFYGKLPLEQAETSKVIQICTQIAAAMAPKLRIVFVKAGNDLSPKTFEGFVKICKRLKLQLWIERYAPVGEEGVVEIVEGEVAGNRSHGDDVEARMARLGITGEDLAETRWPTGPEEA